MFEFRANSISTKFSETASSAAQSESSVSVRPALVTSSVSESEWFKFSAGLLVVAGVGVSASCGIVLPVKLCMGAVGVLSKSISSAGSAIDGFRVN